MSRMPKNLDSNGRRRRMAVRSPNVSRVDVPHASVRLPPRMAAPARRPQPSSEELFGREPFTPSRAPRYYGTGVPFYQSGPGFTGGYYGYGDEPWEIPTELEREYAYDLYGDRDDPPASPPPPRVSPMQAASAFHSAPGEARKYPPGPKGYQRSDERMREEICDELMQTDHIDSSEVTVEVTGGKVTLDGSVPERWMKHAIEDLAAACPGVQEVDARIRIKAATQSA